MVEESNPGKIKYKIFPTKEEASKFVGDEIHCLITKNNENFQKTVFGLATGSTPLPLYSYLHSLHKGHSLSFKNCITFNLDEYLPMSSTSEHSYAYFMKENLISLIDLPGENFNILSGEIEDTEESIEAHCREYKERISGEGGIDLQILGIGRSGHIGFNEPGSLIETSVRMVNLHSKTREDAASSFGGIHNVPERALTMGVSDILKSKAIFIMAWGSAKAPIVKQAIYGDISSHVTATFLQTHPNVCFILDKDAASLL
jgi:glucosamine-6-phosphate deaminase